MDQQPIQRDGAWYARQADGTWLVWKPEDAAWVTGAAPPPPPPPPADSSNSEWWAVEPADVGSPIAAGQNLVDGSPEPQAVRKSSYMERYGQRRGPQLNPLIAAALAGALFVVALGAAFAGGVFGTDEPDRTPIVLRATNGRDKKPLTKEAFIAKADALCRVANDRIRALGSPSLFDLTDAQAAILIETRLVHALRKLQPPTRSRARIDRMLTKVERALGYSILTVKSAAGGSAVTAGNAAARASSLIAQANKISSAYGLKECSDTA